MRPLGDSALRLRGHSSRRQRRLRLPTDTERKNEDGKKQPKDDDRKS